MFTNVNELIPHEVEKGEISFYQIQPIDSGRAKIVKIGDLGASTELSIFIDKCKTKPGFPEMSFVSCIHPTVKQMTAIIQLQFMKNNKPFAYLSYNFIKEKDETDDIIKGYYNITYHENHEGIDRYKIVEGKVDWVSVDNMFAKLLGIIEMSL